MRSWRGAVALVQTLAVALASMALCPCHPVAITVESPHSCCEERGTTVLSAADDCCSQCTRNELRAEAASSLQVVDAQSAVPGALPPDALTVDVSRVHVASLSPSPPPLSAPTPLRI